MSGNLSCEHIEELVVQIFSMHCCLEEVQVKVHHIFEVLDHFLGCVISQFEKENELVGDIVSLESVFTLPQSIKVVDVIIKKEENGRQRHTFDVDIIKNALEDGKAVKLKYKLPIGSDSEFRITSNEERTYACIEHGWHGGDKSLTKQWMSLSSMVQHISELDGKNWKDAQKALFPNHGTNSADVEVIDGQQWEVIHGYIYNPHEVSTALWRSKITISDIFEHHTKSKFQGVLRLLRDNIINAYWRRELGVQCTELREIDMDENCNSEISEIHKISYVNQETFYVVDGSDLFEESLPLNETGTIENKDQGLPHDMLASKQCMPAIGTAIGFVFTGAGVIDLEQRAMKPVDVAKRLALETASGGVTTGVGAVSKILGGSVIGVGGIVAAASLVLSSVYDSIRFAKGKMTKIEYRKSAAKNLGGAAGGLLAGVGTTLLVTFAVSNPVGWALTLGAGAVGVVGGFAGAIGGKKLDKVIWDEGIDQVVHVYEFFGFEITRDCKPLPIYSPTNLMETYHTRVKACHDPEGKGKKDFDWERKCQALFMVLLKFMFPVYQDLVDMTSLWKEKYDSSKKYQKEIIYIFMDLLEDG